LPRQPRNDIGAVPPGKRPEQNGLEHLHGPVEIVTRRERCKRRFRLPGWFKTTGDENNRQSDELRVPVHKPPSRCGKNGRPSYIPCQNLKLFTSMSCSDGISKNLLCAPSENMNPWRIFLNEIWSSGQNSDSPLVFLPGLPCISWIASR